MSRSQMIWMPGWRPVNSVEFGRNAGSSLGQEDAHSKMHFAIPPSLYSCCSMAARLVQLFAVLFWMPLPSPAAGVALWGRRLVAPEGTMNGWVAQKPADPGNSRAKLRKLVDEATALEKG